MKKQRGDGLQITVGVCDDNSLVCESICKKILEVRPNYQIDTYLRGEEILSSKKEYNIIFLDIEMPGMNGLELADEIRSRCGNTPDIAFVTAKENAVYDVFRYNALGFVRKSVLEKDFEEMMGRFLKKWKNLRRKPF